MTETFNVLHVCTGNICRSPMAERIMRTELASRFGDNAAQVEVRGAGTYGGHQGQPMNPPAARVLQEMGVDTAGFVATWLREPQLRWADLVLTATAEHRSEALLLEPQGLRRTFVLKELARLARQVQPNDLPAGTLAERFRALVQQAAELRATYPAASREVDDIDDPYGEPVSEFRATAAQIQAAVRDILRPL